MSQAFVLPIGSDQLGAAVKTRVANCLSALRTCFSGATEPSPAEAYQLWADTTSGFLKIRNAANNGWIKVAPLAADINEALPSLFGVVSSMSATTGPTKIAIAPRAGTIKRIVLLCETASTSSSGNEWTFAVQKRPASAPGTPAALFSATVGTFTALGGVGGGAETVAHGVYVLLPNQNATVAQGDVLEITITKVGSATTLANVRVQVEME